MFQGYEVVAVSHVTIQSDGQEIEIDLKNQALAAFLAWLLPGAGHLYQGRTGKGLLFMVCILVTFFYGLVLGNGKVVYAAWKPENRMLHYAGQIGVGLPAFPALIEAYRANHGMGTLFRIMTPPADMGELNDWHHDLHRNWELGTVFTIIAGLLNLLVIYDAWGGPMQYAPEEDKQAKKGKEKSSSATTPESAKPPQSATRF